MLKTIERVTKQRITVERAPPADLRAQRLELDPGCDRGAIFSDDLEAVRVVVETLGGQFRRHGGGDGGGEVGPRGVGPAAEEEATPTSTNGRRRGRARKRPGERSQHRAHTSKGPMSRSSSERGAAPHSPTGPGGRHCRGDTPRRTRHQGHRDRRPVLPGRVPEPAADEVVAAPRTSTVKGRRGTVRRTGEGG